MPGKIERSRRKAHGSRPSLVAGGERDGYRLAGRFWVESDGVACLGWGRVMLLEKIAQHGSLNLAARSMNMSYRRAWELVERMNRLSPTPLVETATGGRGGGGSRLTAEGEAAVRNFWKLVKDLHAWLDRRDPRLWRSPARPAGKPAGKPRRKKRG
jgi:molybdate transport system regulatory protein